MALTISVQTLLDELRLISKEMLDKVFKIDVTKCHHCKGDMAILAAITNRSKVARYLKHLGIEQEAPARAPPRYQEEPFEADAIEDLCETKATMGA